MAEVIVIGGHGKVARALAPLLVARGHTVTAVIRSAAQIDTVGGDGVSPLVADVTRVSLAEFGELIAGNDVVVWSAGAGGGSPDRTYAVDRDAAVVSIQAALRAGVSRYVMVSWSGSRLDHGVDETDTFYPYAQSKAIADAALRDTDLDWTVIAPSALTDEPATGRLEVADPSTRVTRTDVAATIAACLDDPTSIGRTLRFNNGDVPIADFVRRG